MKKQLAAAVAAFLTFTVANTLQAQGTAFSYQGTLYDGVLPANGSYDIAFTLYDAATNGTWLGSQTNDAVVVSNGTFIVTLDFGNVFNGGNRWLELDVETNGVGPFTILEPRQAVTPTPYAIFAESANSVAATNISGAIALAQLPASVLTNDASNVNISGTFIGDGSGLTNLPASGFLWQTVPGTNQQAAVNTGYLATNATSQVTVTLPASANPGDIIRVSGGAGGWSIAQNAGQTISLVPVGGGVVNGGWVGQNSGSNAWQSVASSADGTHLAAAVNGGYIYTSTNSGITWTAQTGSGSRVWNTIASSADGTKLAAAVYLGAIYTSTNSGVTWTPQNSGSENWQVVVSSADGTKLAAVVYGGQIYTSSNSGVTWTPQSSGTQNWYVAASDAGGTNLVAGVYPGQLYTSANAGVTWTPQPNAGNRNWNSVASSADGTKLVAVAYNGQIYCSANSGVTWTTNDSVRNWQGVASDAGGTNLVAVVDGGLIYTSSNSGATWTPQNSGGTNSWYAAASSSNGGELVVIARGGLIYTYPSASQTTTTTTGTAGYLVGSPWSAIQLQYIANGLWLPISFTGTIQGH